MATNAENIGWGAATAVNPWAIAIKTGFDVLGGLVGGDDDRELNERAIALRERAYGDRAPLRAMALSRLEASRPQRPNLTADFADPSNPFYRAPEPLSFGAGYDTPGNSRGEARLRKQGLESLVEPPGPTPQEQYAALPDMVRDKFPQYDARAASLPENVREMLPRMPKGLRDKVFKKIGG